MMRHTAIVPAILLCLALPSIAKQQKTEQTLREISTHLQAQLQSLQSIKSEADAAQAIEQYEKHAKALFALHEQVSDMDFPVESNRFPELRQEIVNTIQQLALEISRLHHQQYYNSPALRKLLEPAEEPLPEKEAKSPA